MGLITKEVEILLTNNVKYYEDLGYKIPREKNKQGKLTVPIGSKILVKINDLPFLSIVCLIFSPAYNLWAHLKQ